LKQFFCGRHAELVFGIPNYKRLRVKPAMTYGVYIFRLCHAEFISASQTSECGQWK